MITAGLHPASQRAALASSFLFRKNRFTSVAKRYTLYEEGENHMLTIEPDIQEIVLGVLPDDGPLAMDLMCQLLAGMILSIPGSDINKTVERLKFHLAEYEGT